jgi:putative transposase
MEKRWAWCKRHVVDVAVQGLVHSKYELCHDAKSPDAETIIADKGYDSDAFRDALAGRGITACIPPRAKRWSPATYCKTLYRQRQKVENMFAKPNDWRRISMRYDRCAHTLFSAICIAAAVIFWLGQ